MSQEPGATHAWWASLRHGGLLIAPSRLAAFFPDEPPPLPPWIEERLRRDLARFAAGGHNADAALLDTVLHHVLGLWYPPRQEAGHWLRGNDVPREWTHRAISGEAIRPRRLWRGPNDAAFAVFFDDEPRLGIGRGRRSAARVVEWLRRAGQKVALLTNGKQWRLIYAGLDHDAFAEADTALWFEEGRAGAQVNALRALLSPVALAPQQAGALPPLLPIRLTQHGASPCRSWGDADL